MSNDPTQIRRVEPPREIAPFERDGLRFSLAAGLRTVSDGTPGYLFEVRSPDGSLLGTVSGILATEPGSVAEIGHIGVEVAPEWRGRGLPASFARGVIPVLQDEGIADILITCDPANDAMKAAIASLGAEYLDEWPVEGQQGTPKTRFILRDDRRDAP